MYVKPKMEDRLHCTLDGVFSIWFIIKCPTSGGQTHDQEATIQWTFHFERSLVLMEKTRCNISLPVFAHNCTKCTPQLLFSKSGSHTPSNVKKSEMRNWSWYEATFYLLFYACVVTTYFILI